MHDKSKTLPARIVFSQLKCSKMVRSLSHWTKTLSFPARISPNKQSKESVINVHPISPTVTPTPSNNSLSPPSIKNELNNIMNNKTSSEMSQVSTKY